MKKEDYNKILTGLDLNKQEIINNWKEETEFGCDVSLDTLIDIYCNNVKKELLESKWQILKLIIAKEIFTEFNNNEIPDDLFNQIIQESIMRYGTRNSLLYIIEDILEVTLNKQ